MGTGSERVTWEAEHRECVERCWRRGLGGSYSCWTARSSAECGGGGQALAQRWIIALLQCLDPRYMLQRKVFSYLPVIPVSNVYFAEQPDHIAMMLVCQWLLLQ